MALTRRDQSGLSSRNPYNLSTSTFSSSSSSLQQEHFPVPFNGKNLNGNNYEVYLYLARECSGGWFPSFAHGQAAAKSIVNCLLDVSDDRCAMLKAVILPNSKNSDYLPHNVDVYQLGTLREETELCRELFTETLANLSADMDDICSKSGTLCAESGPLVRALNHCDELKPSMYTAQSLHYLDQTDDTHAEMLTLLDTITHRWSKLLKKVSQFNGVLSKQLNLIQRVQQDIGNSIKEKQNNLATLSGKVNTVRADLQETEGLVINISSKSSATQDDIRQAEVECEKLAYQLEARKVDLKQLEYDLEIRPKHFAAAQQREEARVEPSEIQGWGPWIWDAITNPIGNYSQFTHVSTWKATVEEYHKWEEESHNKRYELLKDIDSANDEIKKHQHKMQRLTEDQVLSKQVYSAQRNKLTSKLVSQRRSLQVLEEEQKSIEISVAGEKAVLCDLVRLPSISSMIVFDWNIKEAETNINHSYIAYKHINKKLNDCSFTIGRISQQMRNVEHSQEDIKDLFEDINFLRITFLVVSDMAGRSSTVSRELYSQSLTIMAPMGIRPSGSDVHSLQVERRRIDALGKMGDDAAVHFDQAQAHRETFNRLCSRVENIVNSTGTTGSYAPRSEPASRRTGEITSSTTSESPYTSNSRRTKSGSKVNWRAILRRS
ncbi:hypothetical protein VTL71DRAFT_10984 [Oculimacula yallundae]|uniref:Uncharacterized protein n=1 Tax=Oculimacula yallundae TaxID=86028 RepID=A0ABR4CWE0_9HELO